MTKLTSYDLQQVISKKFVPSLESEQEIEIETDEVVINQIQTTDSEIEELAEESAIVTETSDNLDDVDNTTETLESLIYSMESSILTGGFDVRNAQIANIALESIASQYDIDSSYLTFGMEEVGEDGEAETKSTIDKAKSMLRALKDNASALLSKMYAATLAALGSTTALSEKLIAKAIQLKSNIDNQNKGGNPVKLAKSVKRKLTVDGKTVLAPDKYLSELKRLTSKYNSVVKVYADNDVLAKFTQDVVKGMAGSDKQTASAKAILATVRELSSGITKKLPSKDGIEEAVSEAYLGGARVHMVKPTVAAVQKALTVEATKNNVSQEGVGRLLKASTKVAGGAILAVTSGVGVGISSIVTAAGIKTIFGGASIAAVAAKAGVSFGAVLGGTVAVTLLFVLFAVLWFYGLKKGLKMIGSGWAEYIEEIKKAVEAFKGIFKKSTEDAAEVATEFELETSSVSMEADEATTAVSSLSANQIKMTSDIIIDTAATTRTMKGQLAKRKAIIKEMEAITKALATAEGSNSEATKAASAFIKRYIKQTIKFETQLAAYTVGVMKAALAYAEASNGARFAELQASE